MSDFITGLVEGFANQRQIAHERQQNDELKKLQKKQILAQLELAQKQAEAKGELFNLTQEIPVSPGLEGPPQPAQRSITDVLATPQGQTAALQSGMLDIKGLQDMQQKQRQAGLIERMIEFQLNNAGLPNNQLPVDPVSLLAAAVTGDIGKLKSAEPIIREAMMQDQSKQFVSIPKFGGAPVPVGQSAPSPGQMQQFDPNVITKFQSDDPNFNPIGMTFNELKSSGAKVFSANEKQQRNKVLSTLRTVDNMEQLLAGIPAGDDFSSRLGSGFSNLKQNLLQNNPNISLYDSQKQGMLSMIVKALGESGNLATEDVERAEKLFPQILPTITDPVPDSRTVRDAKIGILRNVLTNISDPNNKKSLQQIINESGGDQFVGELSGPPKGAIDMLKGNPSDEMKQFFDQKYGAGAAERVLGNGE